jgi:hypothetical protein
VSRPISLVTAVRSTARAVTGPAGKTPRDLPRLLSVAALFFLPFQNSPIVNFNLVDIEGLKPITILVVAALAGELSRQKPWSFQDSTERTALLWYLAYIFVFLVVFVRSVPNLPTFHAEFPSQFQSNIARYFLSFFARPALMTGLFVLIVRQFRTKEESQIAAHTLCASVAVLSVSVLAIVLSGDHAYFGDRRALAETLEHYIGLHYNSVGTIYVITGPLVIYLALTRSILQKLCAALVAIAVFLLQSRSSLLIFWFESFAVFLILKRVRLFFLINLVGIGLILVWTPPSVRAIGTVGLDDGGFALDRLLNRRMTLLWAPLLGEWIADPFRLFWGAGRYGILVSQHFATGDIIRATHAHNAFIDTGVVGLTAVVGVVAAGLRRVWRVGRSIHEPLFWALAVCLCGYLVGGVTERGFFPNYDNLLMFPVVALLVNVGRLWRSETGVERERPVAGGSDTQNKAPTVDTDPRSARATNATPRDDEMSSPATAR